jgi:hypothetical protein
VRCECWRKRTRRGEGWARFYHSHDSEQPAGSCTLSTALVSPSPQPLALSRPHFAPLSSPSPPPRSRSPMPSISFIKLSAFVWVSHETTPIDVASRMYKHNCAECKTRRRNMLSSLFLLRLLFSVFKSPVRSSVGYTTRRLSSCESNGAARRAETSLSSSFPPPTCFSRASLLHHSHLCAWRGAVPIPPPLWNLRPRQDLRRTNKLLFLLPPSRSLYTSAAPPFLHHRATSLPLIGESAGDGGCFVFKVDVPLLEAVLLPCRGKFVVLLARKAPLKSGAGEKGKGPESERRQQERRRWRGRKRASLVVK